MKIRFAGASILGLLLGLGAVGCSTGKPGFRSETLRPDQQHDFAVLYKSNCSACHGDGGRNGAALPLDNPVYLTWAGHDRLIGIVSNGVPHRLMPGFSAAGGGLLSDQQIQDIVQGMLSQWTKPDVLNGASAPAYAPAGSGNPEAGQAAFKTYCARCHGADGAGLSAGTSAQARSAAGTHGDAVGSIVDPTYLSLISGRALRDIIVCGMPGENMPDWRGDVAGRPMSDKEVTDVVAWLISHRVQYPGQPFPASPQHQEVPQPAAGRSES